MKFIFLLFISFLTLFANTTFNITESKKSITNFKFEYLIDNTLNLSIKDIAKKKFTESSTNNFSLGYIKGNLWIKFSINNKSLNRNFILTLNETFYEVADLYYQDSNKWIKKENGLFKLIKNREIKTNHLAFNIELPQNKQQTFYLKLKGEYAYFGNLELFEESLFYYKNTLGINQFFIFVLGVILSIVVFTFFLFIKIRERIYFYYLCYSFFSFIYLTYISGLFVFLNLQPYIYKLHFALSLMMGFIVLFSSEFLQIKKYFKKTDKFLKLITIIFFILAFIFLFSYRPWNIILNSLAQMVWVTLIIVSILLFFKGQTNVKYYFFATFLYFIFAMGISFMVSGYFEYNFFTRYGFAMAMMIETVIFTLLLTNRYHEMKKEVQNYLEEKVKERTKNIRVLLKDKELILKELHHRVKNNFHMIIGMLYIEDKKKNYIQNGLSNLIHRVKSISLIHEQLYNEKEFSNIDVKHYLNELVNNIIKNSQNIKLSSVIENIDIKFDDAILLGMIVNELITNSIKHNKSISDLLIEIKLIQINNSITLIVADNGEGSKEKLLKKSLGLKLIEQFCHKLPESKYNYSFKEGTKFELEFKRKIS